MTSFAVRSPLPANGMLFLIMVASYYLLKLTIQPDVDVVLHRPQEQSGDSITKNSKYISDCSPSDTLNFSYSACSKFHP